MANIPATPSKGLRAEATKAQARRDWPAAQHLFNAAADAVPMSAHGHPTAAEQSLRLQARLCGDMQKRMQYFGLSGVFTKRAPADALTAAEVVSFYQLGATAATAYPT